MDDEMQMESYGEIDLWIIVYEQASRESEKEDQSINQSINKSIHPSINQ